MIAWLNGKLSWKDHSYVIIDIGGVGYQVRISLSTYRTLPDLNAAVKLHTYLHIKEDAHTLYGFAEGDEKALFLHLISVSGVGPGTALLILGSLPAAELETAILREDLRTLSGIKGIGTKTAQRLVLELKDKVRKDSISGEIPGIPSLQAGNTARAEALSALVTLGLNKPAAEKTLDAIIKRDGNALSVEDLIKRALKPS
ncbi:MAG: Holliday junction branch migration protein RuvA [Bacteroidota bacterium]